MFKKNNDYFSQHTLQSAYWAGFIAADGCIFSLDRKLSIEVSAKDSDHLQKFIDDIEWEGVLRYRSRDYGSMARVQIGSSKKIIEDLKCIYNIADAKTYSFPGPGPLSDNNKLAFIVGVIDGDGCISKDKRKTRSYTRLTVTTGSALFAHWIESELSILCGKTNNSIYKAGEKTFNVIYCGKAADKILEILKKVPVSRLDRKWAKMTDDYIDTEEVS